MKTYTINRIFFLVVVISLSANLILDSCVPIGKGVCVPGSRDGSSGFSFAFKDGEGRDLLNPETPNHFLRTEVKSFGIKDGKKFQFTEKGKGAASFNYPEENREGKVSLGFMGFRLPNLPPDTILLQLRPTEIDTIRVLQKGIDPCWNYAVFEKISYNGRIMETFGKNNTLEISKP